MTEMLKAIFLVILILMAMLAFMYVYKADANGAPRKLPCCSSIKDPLERAKGCL